MIEAQPVDSYLKIIRYEDKYIDPSDLVKAQSTNAQLWAKSFMDRIALGHFSYNDINEGLLLSWFATIIETTKDSCYHEQNIKEK